MFPEDPLPFPPCSSESRIAVPKVCPACINLESSDWKGSSPGQHSPACAGVSVMPTGRDQDRPVPRQRNSMSGVFITAKVRNASPNIDFFLLFPIIPLCAGQCEDGEGNCSSWCWNKSGGGALWAEGFAAKSALWSPRSISTPLALLRGEEQHHWCYFCFTWHQNQPKISVFSEVAAWPCWAQEGSELWAAAVGEGWTVVPLTSG